MGNMQGGRHGAAPPSAALEAGGEEERQVIRGGDAAIDAEVLEEAERERRVRDGSRRC
jgi:hypothetical protein